ncbi:MAG: PHP domain-containing protein [Promethearchaeota archaeon]
MRPIQGLDLHIHSTWSDGSASPREILKYAASQGFFVAITDHFSKHPAKKSLVFKQVDLYLDELYNLKNQFKFFIGLEIDTYSIPNFREILESLPTWRFDFLLFEYVIDQVGISYFPKRTNWREIFYQLNTFVDQLPSNSLPIGLSHPHLGVLSNKEFEEFSQIIGEHSFIVELNTFYENFRDPRFHTLLKKGYSVTIGTDSHSLDKIAHTESLFAFFDEEELLARLPDFIRKKWKKK